MTYVPRGRHFEEFTVGETFTTAARTVTEGAMDRFVRGLPPTVARRAAPARGVPGRPAGRIRAAQ